MVLQHSKKENIHILVKDDGHYKDMIQVDYS